MAKKTSFTAFDEFNKQITPGSSIKDPTKLIIKPSDVSEKTLLDSITIEGNQKSGLWTINQQMGKVVLFRAIPFQKILIVKTGGKKRSPLLKENNFVTLTYSPANSNVLTSLQVRVVRVCEFANPNDEYKDDHEQEIPTNTVLIEWAKTNPAFITFSDNQNGILLNSQIENFYLQDPPNNKPGDPITSALEDDDTPAHYSVRKTVFRKLEIGPDNDIQTNPNTNPVVAVVDTGIKIVQYPDRNSDLQRLKIVEVPDPLAYKYGYCSVTDYLRASRDADPALDSYYKAIADYERLHLMPKDDIKKNPFDDHLLYNDTDMTDIKGRHGTTIAAIINQKGDTAVLPVKIFNYGGYGTLYDLLCGLNYVLYSQQKNVPVRVVNLSFAGILTKESYRILRNKFVCLARAKIWAVAAAGNSHRELMFNVGAPQTGTSKQVWNLFPACFSNDQQLRVITITSVEIAYYKIVKPPIKSGSTKLISRQKQISMFKKLGLPWKGFYIVPVYKTLYNYSTKFVNVGIVGPFEHIFRNATSDLSPTSFTTAFFSAKLAAFLKDNPNASRQQILANQTFTGTIIDGGIEGDRLMQFT